MQNHNVKLKIKEVLSFELWLLYPAEHWYESDRQKAFAVRPAGIVLGNQDKPLTTEGTSQRQDQSAVGF